MSHKICTFRMDDITPTMNWERFRKVEGLFRKYNISPLIGIIPDNQDSKLNLDEERLDFWEVMKDLERVGWTICQHGYQHVYVTNQGGIIAKNNYSEFAGLSYKEQLEKLSRGKKQLESKGINSDVFMAPAHSYDVNTLKALKKLGFKYVTDGYTHYPYERCGLIFYPCTMSQGGRIRGVDTICLHTNHMSDKEIESLEEFIKVNKDIIYSYNEMIRVTQSEVRNYSFKCYIDERIAIGIREIKKNVSSNKRLHCYMKMTYSSNQIKKMLKRILCIPLLLTKLEEE